MHSDAVPRAAARSTLQLERSPLDIPERHAARMRLKADESPQATSSFSVSLAAKSRRFPCMVSTQ